jgi:hypothetical protein
MKNDWSYSSTPLIRLHAVDRDCFTLQFHFFYHKSHMVLRVIKNGMRHEMPATNRQGRDMTHVVRN